jgi:hypothetical protein
MTVTRLWKVISPKIEFSTFMCLEQIATGQYSEKVESISRPHTLCLLSLILILLPSASSPRNQSPNFRSSGKYIHAG